MQPSTAFFAGLVLGLTRSVTAGGPCCRANDCDKAVRSATNGKQDCSSALVVTLHPTTTVTSWGSSTSDVLVTDIELVTASTEIVVTTTELETDFTTLTALTTVYQTETITAIPTIVESVTFGTTVTVSYSYVTPTALKREALAEPPYASACDDNEYTRACACLGVWPSTVTEPASTETIWISYTAIQTLESTITSIAATKTDTDVVTETSITTVFETNVATQITTLSATLTLPTTVTITEVSTAFATLPPTPPTCTGTGFILSPQNPGTSIAGWKVGLIDSIGVGIYARLFSGGGTPFSVDTNGDVQQFYPGSDLMMVVPTGSGPFKLWFSSAAENVHYNYPTTPVTCTIGDAPGYVFTCTLAGSTTVYKTAVCQDPTYYEWDVWLYTDSAQLALNGQTCQTGPIDAICP